MMTQRSHDLPHDRDRAVETVVARVSKSERAGIARLARIHDRTESREIRRAIRFYLTNFDLADRALRDGAAEPVSAGSEAAQ